jgi:hypothetical protein
VPVVGAHSLDGPSADKANALERLRDEMTARGWIPAGMSVASGMDRNEATAEQRPAGRRRSHGTNQANDARLIDRLYDRFHGRRSDAGHQ